MTYQTFPINNENANQLARISTLLKSLRTKVKNFAVIDKQGRLLGKVNNLVVDVNRQLNFVVSQTDAQVSHKLFLLSSKVVEKIESQTRQILLKVDKSEIEHFSKYLENIERENQVSDMENNLNPQTSNLQTTNVQDSALVAAVEAATDSQIDSVSEDIIRLLGERLIIDRSKHKVGEVIIRKEIETQIVQVPIRREKLIVEQVSPEHKQLAEIDLGQEEISRVDLPEAETTALTSFEGGLTVSGEFTSPKIASLLLNAIALEKNHGCKAVQITILVENEERQKTYQEWFARTSKRQ